MPTLPAITLPPQFLGSTAYYALIDAAGEVTVDLSLPFDKRFKSIHRCTIDGANGPKTLTVPIGKPQSMRSALWSDIVVSAHGSWWNELLTALHSAYGRTPYFEFYIDLFEPLISKDTPGMTITGLDRALDTLLRRLLQIDTPVTYNEDAAKNAFRGSQKDFITMLENSTAAVEYYQVRALKHGFRPYLSAVDLLFNMGPESPFILRQMLPPH